MGLGEEGKSGRWVELISKAGGKVDGADVESDLERNVEPEGGMGTTIGVRGREGDE